MSFEFQHFYMKARPGENIPALKDEFFDQSWKLELVAKTINLYKVYQTSETRFAHKQIWNLYYEAKDRFDIFEPCYNSTADEDARGSGADCDWNSPNDKITEGKYHWNKQRMGIFDPNLAEFDNIPLPPGIPNAKRHGEGIYVAVPDTGYFDTDELVPNPQFRPDLGWDIFYGDSDPHDSPLDKLPNEPAWSSLNHIRGHGTSTASLIIGRHNRNVQAQMKGFARKAFVVPIRTDKGVALPGGERLIRAIDYGISLGCRVFSICMGFPAPTGVTAMNGLLKHATEEGIIVCAAAAQFWPIPDWLPAWICPAISPFAICVTGTDYNNTIWRKSFTGKHVSVAAPGEFVYKTGFNDVEKRIKYEKGCGTSFATPAVASAAANWYALYTPEFLHNRYGKSFMHFAFRYIMEKYGVTKPASWHPHWGKGILNFVNLLSIKPQSLPSQQEVVNYTHNLISSYRQNETDAFLEPFNFKDEEEFYAGMSTMFRINNRADWLKEYKDELFHILYNAKYNSRSADADAVVNEIKMQGSDKLIAQLI
jgi:hypothetical protein